MKNSKKPTNATLKAAYQALGDSIVDVPRVLVVDDDPLFRKRISVEAKRQNIPLTVCATPQDLGRLDRRDFDVALIDHYLEDDLFGSDLASIMGPTPVVMMSSIPQRAIEENYEWPASVRKFVSKERGMKELLKLAITVSQSVRT